MVPSTRLPTLQVHEELPAAFEWVPYSKLEAFYAGPDKGWGLRAAKPIFDGQFVVEVLGRCMSEDGYECLEDHSFAVGFPENVLEAKRQAGDPLHYIDPKVRQPDKPKPCQAQAKLGRWALGLTKPSASLLECIPRPAACPLTGVWLDHALRQ